NPGELPAGREDIGRVSVVARNGTQAVRAQELVFVEHLRQHAAEPDFVQDGKEAPAGKADLSWIVNRPAQLWASVEEPSEPLQDLRVLVALLRLEEGGCAKRQQAHHGTNLEPVGRGALRSNTPMLSSPRKPPSKTFRPERSLRLTHQVKFSSSFWKQLFSHSVSPCPCSACSKR